METTMKMEAVGAKKELPSTRADFLLAAAWLARAASRAGRSSVGLLCGPDKDDEAAGICIGYADQRDRI